MYVTQFHTRFCDIILAGNEHGLSHLHLNTGEGSRQFEVLPTWKRNHRFFQETITQLLEYLDGTRQQFHVAINPQGTVFQKQVWEELCRIPYGMLKSYGEIASALGNEKAARAVGNASSKNPIPLIIPCHRVVGANGRLTGFAHGISIKKQLIGLEQKRQ